MKSFFIDAGKFLRDFCISILLWSYFTLVVTTWHFARMTPEWAVLLRVSASVLNDLVWIPLSVLAWSVAFVLLLRLFNIMPARELFVKTVVFLCSVLLHVVFTETAFRFLFVPLTVVGIDAVRKLVGRPGRFRVLGRYVPLMLVGAMTVFHYQGQLTPFGREPASDSDLKVMSYNILRDGKPDDRRAVIETIRRENADIVCVIEYNYPGDVDLFLRGLGEIYPYSVLSDEPNNAWTGSIIFSRYPLRKLKESDLNRVRNKWSSRISIIFAEAEIRGRKVNIVNYHLKSVGHYIEYIADKDYDLKWKIDWAARNESKYDREKLVQAQSLVDLSANSSEPTILCGDLNDTPNSRAFHTLQREYANTFSAKGWGLGSTFGEVRIREKLGWIPLVPLLARDVIRIDHIFASRELRIKEARVLSDAPGSDHKPVTAVLELD